MLPWGHLAFGYLVYSAATRVLRRRAPDGPSTLVLALGTQFPDLVDKPLNWWFDVYDGRAVAHSLVTLVPLCLLLFVAAERSDRRDLAAAFSLGVLTHLVGDSLDPFLSGSLGPLSFLLWPLRPAPTYAADSFSDHLRSWLLELRTFSAGSITDLLAGRFGFQILLASLVVGVWALDGFPGVRTTWRLLTRRTTEAAADP